MAKYYRKHPWYYDPQKWATDECMGGHYGMRVYDGEKLEEDECLHCPYCLEEASNGDIAYCDHCEAILEGDYMLVLNEQELEYCYDIDHQLGAAHRNAIEFAKIGRP